MSEYSQYRQAAWKLLKPVLPIMMLIAIISSLPSFVTTFVTYQTGVGDLLTQFLNGTTSIEQLDPAALLPTSITSLLMSIIALPLNLSVIGAAMRLCHSEEISVRNALDYLPHTLRVIGLSLLSMLYAYWPLLIWAVCSIPVALLLTQGTLWLYSVYILAGIALCVVCIPRGYSVIATSFLQARTPREKLRTLLQRSVQSMRGFRMAFFMLTFSFIGWNLLSTLVSSFAEMLFGTLIGNMISMLVSSVLTCYMTVAQALFIIDITAEKPQQEAAEEL